MKRLALSPRWISAGFLTAYFLTSFITPASADTSNQPVVVSFTMSPDVINLSNQSSTVSIDLIVSNPTGIASTQTTATLSNSTGISLATYLLRSESPINTSLQKVTFHGSLSIPSTIPSGIYSLVANPIVALNSDGSVGLSTPTIKATTTSPLVGAPNNVLIRKDGYLNFSYPTFVGPTFNNLLGGSFVNPSYNSAAAPIWKVGETFHPSDFYELKVTSLTLKVSTATPSTCTSDGTTLTFTAIGACSFTVYTDQSFDYQSYKDIENVSVTAARVKPTYNVGTIADQSSSILPLTIPGPLIFNPTGGLISPVSATPTVCSGAGSYINIISGGTCTLNYSSPATAAYLASDNYTLTFQIKRNAQTISFTPPTSVKLSSKVIDLAASSSSGLPVTFQSSTPAICSVTGSSLNVLKAGGCSIQAMQAGSTTIAPASVTQSLLITGSSPVAKKLVCIKAGKAKVVLGTKCPTGYRAKN